MQEYTLIEISAFNNKKQKEYDKYVDKVFKMKDKLKIGDNIILQFKSGEIKAKLEDIVKEKEVNVDKKFVLTTNNYVAIIQLAK